MPDLLFKKIKVRFKPMSWCNCTTTKELYSSLPKITLKILQKLMQENENKARFKPMEAVQWCKSGAICILALAGNGIHGAMVQRPYIKGVSLAPLPTRFCRREKWRLELL